MNIDDALLDAASTFTGIEERSRLVNEVFQRFVSAESAKRLRSLSGTAPDFEVAPRSQRPDASPQSYFVNEDS